MTHKPCSTRVPGATSPSSGFRTQRSSRLRSFQQLGGGESERSFLGDAWRFFSHLFPGVAGRLHPSSFHRRVRNLRRYLGPLRGEILPEPAGEPETLIVDSALLSIPRQVKQSAAAGFKGVARGEAARRDRHLEPREDLRAGRNFGHNARRAGHEGRGEDSGLQPTLFGQQDVGAPSRPHRGAVGMSLPTHI